jgi:hypothetical protein
MAGTPQIADDRLEEEHMGRVRDVYPDAHYA